jgi:hypothetical protein
MDGEKLTHTSYALDRNSRKAALANFLAQGQQQQIRKSGRPHKRGQRKAISKGGQRPSLRQ